ncbi:hypothetical protein [Spirosoma linguale]
MKPRSTPYFKLLLVITASLVAFVVLYMILGKKGESSQPSAINQSEKLNSEPVIKPSVNGVYSYTDNSAELEIVVSDNHWSGKTIMKSGFGNAYDEQNAIRDNGIVKEGYLYDDSGMVKIGNVSDGYLYTSVGQNSVTLRKM